MPSLGTSSPANHTRAHSCKGALCSGHPAASPRGRCLGLRSSRIAHRQIDEWALRAQDALAVHLECISTAMKRRFLRVQAGCPAAGWLASLWSSSSLPAGRCMGLYGSRLAPMTAMAPRSSREKLFSADQPSRIASSALAAPALPGRYLLDGTNWRGLGCWTIQQHQLEKVQKTHGEIQPHSTRS